MHQTTIHSFKHICVPTSLLYSHSKYIFQKNGLLTVGSVQKNKVQTVARRIMNKPTVGQKIYGIIESDIHIYLTGYSCIVEPDIPKSYSLHRCWIPMYSINHCLKRSTPEIAFILLLCFKIFAFSLIHLSKYQVLHTNHV